MPRKLKSQRPPSDIFAYNKRFFRPIWREVKPVARGTLTILGTMGGVFIPVFAVAVAINKLPELIP